MGWERPPCAPGRLHSDAVTRMDMPQGPDPYSVTVDSEHTHLGLAAGSMMRFAVSPIVSPGPEDAPAPGTIVAIWHKSGFGPRVARVASPRGAKPDGLTIEVSDGGRAIYYWTGLRRVDVLMP